MSLEPCKGETGVRMPGTFGSTRRLLRPVGAWNVSFGFLTQGDAPRRLGACPGLSDDAPLGPRAPKSLDRMTRSARLPLFKFDHAVALLVIDQLFVRRL